MIDLHSHILYGVDDGCKTIGDSINMIKESFRAGVTDLVLTPHYSFRRKYSFSYEEIERRFNILKEEVSKNGLKINLYLGSEIDETSDLDIFLSNGMCHTMNDSKYVLLDFGTRKANVDDICYELIVKGYIPIIAHPERYKYIHGIDKIKQWKNTGALIQINASSLFLGGIVKKQANALLSHNLVDIVASDTHRNVNAIEYLKKAYKYISKKQGKEKAKSLFIDTPFKIIDKNY